MAAILKKYDQRIFRWFHTLVMMTCLVGMVGCEDFFISEAENVKIPGSKPRLVVNSYISPQDTQVKVYVTRSMPHMQRSSDYKPVGSSAQVLLAAKGEEFVPLAYNHDCNCYAISALDFEVKENTYYVLKIQTPEGEYAEAECYVPGFEAGRIEISEPVQRQTSWGDKVIEVDWQITPEKGKEEKYFRTQAFLHAYEISPDNQIDTTLFRFEHMWINRGKYLFSDRSGNTYNLRAEYYRWQRYYYYDPETGEVTYLDEEQNYLDTIFIEVLQTDRHYFLFHQSLDNYYYHDEDFPFSESVHIYSNVKGGLGTFGGYNRRSFYVTRP